MRIHRSCVGYETDLKVYCLAERIVYIIDYTSIHSFHSFFLSLYKTMKYKCRFDADAFKEESVWRAFYADCEGAVVILENHGEENPHYHAAFSRPTKIGQTRLLFHGKEYCHLAKRGNGAYSLTYMDESREDEYIRYLMKCDRRMSFDEFRVYTNGKLINTTHRTLEDLHQAHEGYWNENEKLRSSSKKKAPTFTHHLLEEFAAKHKEYYEKHFINNTNYDGFASDHERRRIQYVIRFILKELGAAPKVYDDCVVMKFINIIENRFNPNHVDDFATRLSDRYLNFGR